MRIIHKNWIKTEGGGEIGVSLVGKKTAIYVYASISSQVSTSKKIVIDAYVSKSYKRLHFSFYIYVHIS